MHLMQFSVFFIVFATAVAAQDFPRWLGPKGTGVVSAETTIRTKFDGPVEREWLIKLSGNGKKGNQVQGSPVAAHGQAYYLSVEYGPQSKERLSFAANKSWMKVYGQKGQLSKEGLDFCLKTSNANVRWDDQAAFDAWLATTPLADKEKAALREGLTSSIPSSKNKFHAVSLDSGEELWSVEWEGGRGPGWGKVHATPLIADNVVYVVDGGGITHAFDTKTGTRRWQSTEAVWGRYAGANSSPILHDGRLIIMRQIGVIALSIEDGSLLWDAKDVPNTEDNTAAIYNSPNGDVILVGSAGESSVHALDPETGKVLWKIDEASSRYTTPVVVGNTMVTQMSGRGGTNAFDLSTQPVKKLWQVPITEGKKPPQCCSTPAVNADWVWWGNQYGLRCMSLKDGSIRWEKKYDVDDNASIILCGKVLIVLTHDAKKQLYWNLIDADSGDILHTQSAEKKKELGKLQSTPAIADGRLLLKGISGFACWDLRARE